MFVRKLLTGGIAGAMALSAIALTAGSASAVYASDPDDYLVTSPVAGDIFGAGSDTTQGVMHDLAMAYDATSPASRLVTYSALGGGTIPLAGATPSEPNRPTSSGTGRTLLINDANLDFARSSGAISDSDISAGLVMYPFARDGLQMAVAGGSSYAPANITDAQIVSIYKCQTTNWSQLGGPNVAITPLAPGSSSGTYSFWVGQLKAANGGNTFAPDATCTKTVQEHDPAPVNDGGTNPGAIAPFSFAKALKATQPVKLLGGFAPTRPVYNVLRGNQASGSALQAIFGPNGYICSAAGKTVIENAGFRQLLPVNKGGVCGAQTTTAPSNTLVDQVATSTQVSVTSASASSARAVAKIVPADPSTTPVGTVTFYEGSTVVASNVPLASGGQATASPAAAPGTHSYRAVYVPAANSAFLGSEGAGAGTVAKASSVLSESFAAKAKTVTKKGKVKVKPLKGSIVVSLTGSSSKASGTVIIKRGSKTVGTGTLSGGVATFTIKKGLKPGTNKLSATFVGDANATGSAINFTVKVAKPKKKK